MIKKRIEIVPQGENVDVEIRKLVAEINFVSYVLVDYPHFPRHAVSTRRKFIRCKLRVLEAKSHVPSAILGARLFILTLSYIFFGRNASVRYKRRISRYGKLRSTTSVEK